MVPASNRCRVVKWNQAKPCPVKMLNRGRTMLVEMTISEIKVCFEKMQNLKKICQKRKNRVRKRCKYLNKGYCREGSFCLGLMEKVTAKAVYSMDIVKTELYKAAEKSLRILP